MVRRRQRRQLSAVPAIASVRHIETLLTSRTARLRDVGAAAPGECLAMVRSVPPPLRRCSATSPRRSADMAGGCRVRARGQRRSVDRVQLVFTAAGPRSSARTTRWRPTNTVELVRPVWARAPGRGAPSTQTYGFNAMRRSAPAIPDTPRRPSPTSGYPGSRWRRLPGGVVVILSTNPLQRRPAPSSTTKASIRIDRLDQGSRGRRFKSCRPDEHAGDHSRPLSIINNRQPATSAAFWNPAGSARRRSGGR